MFSPSSDYSESRPFKIFISLLDKWEIGAALTEKIVYDSFKAIKQLIESGSDSDGGGTGKDVRMLIFLSFHHSEWFVGRNDRQYSL